MATVDMQLFREHLKEVMDFVRFKNGTVTIVRRGRPIAYVVPVEQKGQCPAVVHRSAAKTSASQRDSQA